MKALPILALLLTFPAWAGEQCRAIDGDTLRCGSERVRLKGIYAPELREAGGPEAKQRLQQRIQTGDVRIDRTGHDRYGRSVGTVHVNGQRVQQGDISAKGGRGLRR
jgi:endonuclease YncB( thermonuclease family)